MSAAKSGWPFGRVLFEARRRLGMSAQSLADMTGISRSVIANLENGRKSDIEVGELVLFATALGVVPAALDPRVDPAAALRIAEAQQALRDAENALTAAILGGAS